jgi:hypothetical protein
MADGKYTNEEFNEMYAAGVLTIEMLIKTI